MDATTMVQLLVPNADLTSGQLAQMRALDYRYFTARARHPTDEEMADLHASMVTDIRAMLTPEQTAAFDDRLSRVRDQIFGGTITGK